MMGWQGKEVHFNIITRLIFDELTNSSIEIPHYAKLKNRTCNKNCSDVCGECQITINSEMPNHVPDVKNMVYGNTEKGISDDEIDKAAMASMEEIYHSPNDTLSFYLGWNRAIKWYREQLKSKQ